MGAGKSSVGEILAEKLNRDFYDTDKLVEESTGKSTSKIFESEGEGFFRDKEEEIIKKITAELNKAVIALGGGTILRRNNWELITRSGVIVYLQWKFNSLINRLANDDSRPLAAKIPREFYQTEILKLFELRKPIYAQADFIIDCSDDLTETQVADEIVHELEKRK